jgi:hypothetical protein
VGRDLEIDAAQNLHVTVALVHLLEAQEARLG